MNTYKKLLLAAVLVAPAAIMGATQANAQAVAVADPQGAIGNTKAFTTAVTQIRTQYKAQLDQSTARRAAVQKEIEALALALDTDKNGQVSQQELEAAQAAKRPEIAAIQQKQTAVQQEVGRLEAPAARAQQYAAEQIALKYEGALQSVVSKRGVQLIVRPDAVVFAQPASDLTPAITTELDTLVPTVSITPPANWQPGQAGAAAQQAAPAAPAKKPTTR
ncbi:OmpH family outer membrane protein [Sphingomonas aliaeris]|uniref:OmpH family outer membrane protein n=1 Tax=Sphingomonas aliaeris TaxID=2759526 RepID=A0A974S5M8_9SPHN|nr:OmpH family outer membrane protein [Sphingomonas aliaeris]QQV78729.1 OmpH family outer membrane protein [Sphingomonas aliaeris]